MHETHKQDLLHRESDLYQVNTNIDEVTSAHSFVNVDASGVEGMYCQKANNVAISSSCPKGRDGI